VPGRSWAKTVICFAEDEPVAIAAVVPAPMMVDLVRLAALAAVGPLRLAREDELVDFCPGGELGAISPFVSRQALRVFVDRSFVGDPEMVFSAGTHSDAIRMHYLDFAEVTSAVVGVIATSAQAFA
jgi:Ala-tRNA(Pro) deacylase